MRGVDPARFVWIDETGSHLGMTRRYSRAPRGRRAYGTAPGSRGKSRTLIAALTLAGIGLLLDRAIDRAAFDAYVVDRLAPTLTAGQIVVADNLTAHDSDRATAAIEARGARLRYPPPCSPGCNPIEEACSKLEAALRSAEPRTLEEHSAAVWAALRSITPHDAAGWFAHAGHGTPRRRPKRPSARRRPTLAERYNLPPLHPVTVLHVPTPILFDHLW